jgi:hypothetical protein
MLLSLLLACAHHPASDGAEHPLLLWRAERDGKTNWLLGTCHVGVSLDYALPPPHDAALTGARIVYTEAEMNVGNPGHMLGMLLSDGPGLSEQLSPEDWRAIAVMARGTLPAPFLERMHPWVASLFLQFLATNATPSAKDAAAGDMMDREVQKRAAAHDIPRAYVESLDEQAAMLTAHNDVFLKSLHPTKGDRHPGNVLSDVCYKGDTSDVKSLFDPDDPLTGPLVVDRNHAWIPKLEPELEKGGVFVAVGAAHLVGDEGLVALLRRDGYTVTQLTTTRPIEVGSLGGGGGGIPTPAAPSPRLDAYLASIPDDMAGQLCREGQIVPTCFLPDHDACVARIRTDTALCVRQYADLFPPDGSAPKASLLKDIATCAPVGVIVEGVAKDRMQDAPMCGMMKTMLKTSMGAASGG